MTIDRAMGLLKMAVPMRAVTMSEFNDFIEAVNMAIYALENLSSAEPRKKGKWIFIHPLQADDEGAYICSNCHRGDWDIKPTDKYCKFCGMAMDIYATLLP